MKELRKASDIIKHTNSPLISLRILKDIEVSKIVALINKEIILQ